MKLKLIALATASVMALGAQAQTFGKMSSVLSKSTVSVNTVIGSTGAGIGASIKLPQANTVIRTDYTAFDDSAVSTKGSNQYSLNLDSSSFTVGVDLHPYRNAFKISGGLMITDTSLTGRATARNGSFTFNNRQVAAQAGDFVQAGIELPTAMPYVGLGFSNLNENEKGFSYFVDLGVAYGKPKVSLDASANLKAAAGSDFESERQKLQDDADDFKVIPMLKVGLGLRF